MLIYVEFGCTKLMVRALDLVEVNRGGINLKINSELALLNTLVFEIS